MGSSRASRGDARSRAPPRWTPEEAAEYSARRDFRLVQLLSKDRDAFRAAQRLGIFRPHRAKEQDHGAHARSSSSGVGTRDAGTSTHGGDAACPRNHRQRKSVERAIAHQAALAASAVRVNTQRASAAAPAAAATATVPTVVAPTSAAPAAAAAPSAADPMVEEQAAEPTTSSSQAEEEEEEEGDLYFDFWHCCGGGAADHR